MAARPPQSRAEALPTPVGGGPFRAFAYRDFVLFWGGSLLAISSFFMLFLVRGQLMLNLTSSPFMVSAISAAPGLPMFFLGLLGGALADRVSRKAILIGAEAVNLVVLLTLAALVLTEQVQVWQIFLLSILNGITFALALPARAALVPNLLRPEDMASGVALATTIFSGAQFVGPALAGYVMPSFGMGIAFLVPALLPLPALLLFSLMRPRQEGMGATSQGSVLRSILDGFVWVRGQPVIKGLLLLGVASAVFGISYQALLPVFSRDLLSGPGATVGLLGLPEAARSVLTPELGLGLLGSVAGLGAILGSLTVAAFGHGPQRRLLLMGGGLGFGLSIALFALSPIFLLSLFFSLSLGVLSQIFLTNTFTLIQVLSPDHIRGRVISINSVIFGLVPLGQFALGIAAEVMSTPLAVTAFGGLFLLFAAVIVLAVPALRRV